jgi:hypothetical protein
MAGEYPFLYKGFKVVFFEREFLGQLTMEKAASVEAINPSVYQAVFLVFLFFESCNDILFVDAHGAIAFITDHRFECECCFCLDVCMTPEQFAETDAEHGIPVEHDNLVAGCLFQSQANTTAGTQRFLFCYIRNGKWSLLLGVQPLGNCFMSMPERQDQPAASLFL